eukprot:SAG25_NODE_342_length_9432_cov_2.769305_2_plen_238_part_00
MFLPLELEPGSDVDRCSRDAVTCQAVVERLFDEWRRLHDPSGHWAGCVFAPDSLHVWLEYRSLKAVPVEGYASTYLQWGLCTDKAMLALLRHDPKDPFPYVLKLALGRQDGTQGKTLRLGVEQLPLHNLPGRGSKTDNHQDAEIIRQQVDAFWDEHAAANDVPCWLMDHRKAHKDDIGLGFVMTVDELRRATADEMFVPTLLQDARSASQKVSPGGKLYMPLFGPQPADCTLPSKVR